MITSIILSNATQQRRFLMNKHFPPRRRPPKRDDYKQAMDIVGRFMSLGIFVAAVYVFLVVVQ